MRDLTCEYRQHGYGCELAAEFRVHDATDVLDTCRQHVGPVLSGVAVARVVPILLTEDGAAGNVIAFRQPRQLSEAGLIVQRRAA